MYEALRLPPPDRIMELTIAFRADRRPDKLDLGIGIYRDAEGKTPVMRAVKAAEQLQLQTEDTKAYIGFFGDERFNAAMVGMTLGSTVDSARVVAAQTPGGGGAIRLIAELIRDAAPHATVWISDRTWVNHNPIMDQIGLERRAYPYLDLPSQSVAFDEMLRALRGAKVGDVVLLHACCHNPTGSDLTIDQWNALARLCNERGLIPFIDLAYQGFGNGVEPDVRGLRCLAAQVPELLIAASCSKNFGLYRDRVGCAIACTSSGSASELVRANLGGLARVNYSFPPNHGAAIVTHILESPTLRSDWMEELEAMRRRIASNRIGLAESLRLHAHGDRFNFIVRHSGMFSILGLSELQVQHLRERDAIFMPPESRINLTGLTPPTQERVALAIGRALEV